MANVLTDQKIEGTVSPRSMNWFRQGLEYLKSDKF